MGGVVECKALPRVPRVPRVSGSGGGGTGSRPGEFTSSSMVAAHPPPPHGGGGGEFSLINETPTPELRTSRPELRSSRRPVLETVEAFRAAEAAARA